MSIPLMLELDALDGVGVLLAMFMLRPEDAVPVADAMLIVRLRVLVAILIFIPTEPRLHGTLMLPGEGQ